MLKLITLEISQDYDRELHKADCRDLAKKADFGIELTSIDEAKEVIAGESRIRIEETGQGFEFEEVVKVFPCVNH